MRSEDSNGSAALLEVLTTDVPTEHVTGMLGRQLVTVGDWKVGVLTLSRPEHHNSLNLGGWRGLASALDSLAEDSSVRAVVIRGAGDRAFSAGADISEFPAQRLGAEAARSYNAALSEALRRVAAIPVPVIAMVDGLAVGGGCELAAACDVRLASSRSRFGIPVGRLGVTLGLTETRAVSRAIGAANLKYLLLSGVLIDADHAEGWGLVQRVVPEAELAQATADLVVAVAKSSEVTIRAAKLVTDLAASDPSASEDHPLLEQLHREAYDGQDLREGVEAFLSRRPAKFTETRSDHGRA